MKLLITPHQLSELKSRDLVSVSCEYCGNAFSALVKDVRKVLTGSPRLAIKYCSKECLHKAQDTRQTILCTLCNKPLTKQKKKISKHNFCSRQCSGKYNTAHKTHGYSRSKLELWLESKLKDIFVDLDFLFNDRERVNAELDIYIPSLNIAFELNGIFHYEPIYGKEKLHSIQNNDTRKFQACLEQGIELCIINTTEQNRFTEQSSKKYLDIIVTIIRQKQL